jgi:alkylation response protein AidB-like acyl-CoA dehydrogenase
MDFAYTDDQLALREAVRRYCDAEYPAHQRGDVEAPTLADQRRAGLAALGLHGLGVDAEHGGSGLGAVEALVVAQELGRALAGGAWLPSAAVVAPLLCAAATPTQAEAWLTPLAEGRLQAALACHEPQARHALADVVTTATPDGSGWRLDGHKALVLGGDTADLLVIVARTAGPRHDTAGLGLFLVPAGAPGLNVQALRLLDGRGAAQLRLDGVRVPASHVLGTPGTAWPLVEQAAERAAAALCADAAGALEALLAQTVEHLKTRRQFGVPLARFQVLQHRLADMALALEQVRSMACLAAMALDSDDAAQRHRLVSAAKALVGPLARRCGLDAIQMHGAMGMTDECRIGHLAKRLITDGVLFGDASHHLDRFRTASSAVASPAPSTLT